MRRAREGKRATQCLRKLRLVCVYVCVCVCARKGSFIYNDLPFSFKDGFDYCGGMDPLYMCRLSSKLFVH